MAQSRRAGSAQSKVATTTVRIPEDVQGRVRVIAGVTGTTPGDVLSTAFEEYLENHRDDFANYFELAQKMVFSGDVDSMMQMTKSARSRPEATGEERLRGATARPPSELPHEPGGTERKEGTGMDLSSLREQRKAILDLAAKNGAKHVRVFGSVSRGEAEKESDVDFLVELDEDRSLLDHSRLILDLEDLLGRKVHVVTPRSLHRLIRDRVMAEAQPL